MECMWGEACMERMWGEVCLQRMWGEACMECMWGKACMVESWLGMLLERRPVPVYESTNRLMTTDTTTKLADQWAA